MNTETQIFIHTPMFIAVLFTIGLEVEATQDKQINEIFFSLHLHTYILSTYDEILCSYKNEGNLTQATKRINIENMYDSTCMKYIEQSNS